MVKKTPTGLFLRLDENGELLVYSPYTGLIFSCREDAPGRQHLIHWLTGKESSPPSKGYAKSIGAGWFVPLSAAKYPRRRQFRNTRETRLHRLPDKPLLINWFVTGRCTCRCVYCYAQDLMAASTRDPTPSEIRRTAKNILAFDPLAIVLTGGDPLCCENIEIAIRSLHKKAGIIVDTNGLLLTEEHVQMFKRYGVFVRVSIDSERPQVNRQLRPSKTPGECSLRPALKCIDLCLRAHVPIAIQTVVTKKNLSDIASLFPKIARLGVQGWRLLLVALQRSFADHELYKPNARRFYRNITDSLKVNCNGCDEGMWIQVIDSDNEQLNAVILVSPDGRFYTQQDDAKVLLDEASPWKPSLNALKDGINRFAHLDRYLSINALPPTYVGK